MASTLCNYTAAFNFASPEQESAAERTSDEYEMSLNFTQVEKLYIVVATLGGALILALMVLAICYCKVHETYKIFTLGRMTKQGGYVRHTE
jgi:hypothetical protein